MPILLCPVRRRSVILEGLEARRMLAQIVVTTLDDSGDGSLRSAITQANAMPDHDEIVFAPGLTGTINLASALPAISTDMEIQGPGPDLLTIRRDTGGLYDVLQTTHFPTVRIVGLTLTNGRYGIEASIEPRITITNCRITGNLSGGIWNDARMTVEFCTISDNAGPGIHTQNLRSLTVTNSTISGNSAASGGGILFTGSMSGSVTINLINTTISGNSANLSGGGVSFSGHPINPQYRLTILNCTITDNRADADGNGSGTGGGIHIPFANASIRGTIIAGNFRGTGTVSDDLTGGPFSGDANFIGGDPVLGPLADNGGPTLTHALLPPSPAIDAGPADPGDLTTDQRGPGFARHVSERVDIGAFEVQVIVPVVRHREFQFDQLPMSLSFRFSTDVSPTLGLDDFTIHNLTDQAIVTPASFDYDLATNTATVEFDGILPDARFRAVISAAGVIGANGQPMYQDEVFDFHFLMADANNDGRVNLTDFNVLAANFGTSSGATFSQGDFNYDGQVNLADFNVLASRFGMALSPAAGQAALETRGTTQSDDADDDEKDGLLA